MAGPGRISSLNLIIACISILSLTALYISAFGGSSSGSNNGSNGLSSSWFNTEADKAYTYTLRDPTPKSGWVPDLTAENLLCSYQNEEDIASFIWSHRAAVNADPTTGTALAKDSAPSHASSDALATLLDAGITHFDVDICYFAYGAEHPTNPNDALSSSNSNSNSNSEALAGDFYVAHPSQLNTARPSASAIGGDATGHSSTAVRGLQTLRSFLQQIEAHANVKRILSTASQSQSQFHAPGVTAVSMLPSEPSVFITLEPKFMRNAPFGLKSSATTFGSGSGSAGGGGGGEKGYWVWNEHNNAHYGTKTLLGKMIEQLQSTSTFTRTHTAVIAADSEELHQQESLMQATAAKYGRISGAGTGASEEMRYDVGVETSMNELLRNLGSTTGSGDLQNMHVAVSMKRKDKSSKSKSGSSSGIRSVGAEVMQEDAFEWKGCPNWHMFPGRSRDGHEDGSAQVQDTSTHIGRVHSTHSDISNITYGTPHGSLIGCGGCCTPMPHYTSQYKQIVMPDVSLLMLTHAPLAQQTEHQIAEGSVFSSICSRRGSQVIVWIVDTPESALKALEMNANGIISNKPLQLLESLKRIYRTKC